jgi:DNA-binding response OmpR family regulator
MIISDVMMPKMTGYELCRAVRADENLRLTPFILVTSKTSVDDKIEGLEAGADDYLPKPFDLSVLIARIHALLRRREWLRKTPQEPSPVDASNIFEFGSKIIDFEALELRSGDQTVHLTLMEADLLRYLINHDGRIVSRSAILEDVWGLREDTDTRAIDNFIVRLRKYIEDEPSSPRHLLTVRGVGYKFVSEESKLRVGNQ